MKRRLYFLLPDVQHTRLVINELQAAGIEHRQMHVVPPKGVDLQDLPIAPRTDPDARLENFLWNGNLVLFFGALLLLVVLAAMDVSALWLLLPAAVMLATFLVGAGFTRHVPNVHLSEFADALRHQEVLLMVDVPADQVARIEELVHRHHPEAVTGGIGWHADALQT